MAISDKLLELNTIKNDIKTAITNKGQTVDNDMTTYAAAISSIIPSLQTKNITPTTSEQVVTPDSGYDGLESVTINAISTETVTVSHSTQTQHINASEGKYISKVTIPPAIGITPIFSVGNVSAGTTKVYSVDTTVDLPIDTAKNYSQMSTIFLVTVECDDMLEPVCFPFSVITTEEHPSESDVYPETGYSQIAVPSSSANYDSFETTIVLSVSNYTGIDGGGEATLQFTVTTESQSAEYNLVVYKVDKFVS